MKVDKSKTNDANVQKFKFLNVVFFIKKYNTGHSKLHILEPSRTLPNVPERSKTKKKFRNLKKKFFFLFSNIKQYLIYRKVP